MVSNIHTRLPRREFLKKRAVIGAGAALGGMSLDSIASGYQLPGAVAAEPNTRLQMIWRLYHDTSGRTALDARNRRDVPQDLRWRNFPRSLI